MILCFSFSYILVNRSALGSIRLDANDATKTFEPFIKFPEESENVSTVEVAKWQLKK